MTARLDSAAAAALLGVKKETLYAYVSRGLLRGDRDPARPRESRYRKEDVLALKTRRELRGDPSLAAAEGLHWGLPVLSSSLTLVDAGRVYYRGRDVARLARESTVEAVAALLWTGTHEGAPGLFAGDPPVVPRAAAGPGAGLQPIERCQVVLPLA